jgi:hypothetical protein
LVEAEVESTWIIIERNSRKFLKGSLNGLLLFVIRWGKHFYILILPMLESPTNNDFHKFPDD